MVQEDTADSAVDRGFTILIFSIYHHVSGYRLAAKPTLMRITVMIP